MLQIGFAVVLQLFEYQLISLFKDRRGENHYDLVDGSRRELNGTSNDAADDSRFALSIRCLEEELLLSQFEHLVECHC